MGISLLPANPMFYPLSLRGPPNRGYVNLINADLVEAAIAGVTADPKININKNHKADR